MTQLEGHATDILWTEDRDSVKPLQPLTSKFIQPKLSMSRSRNTTVQEILTMLILVDVPVCFWVKLTVELTDWAKQVALYDVGGPRSSS